MWQRYLAWRREQPPTDYWLLGPQTFFLMGSALVFSPAWYVGVVSFLLFLSWQVLLLPLIRARLKRARASEGARNRQP